MIAAQDSMVASTQRAIPLQGRDDLIVKRIEYLGFGSWVIKDPVALKYHRLQGEQYHTLRLLDGQRNLEEIKAEIQKEFPTLSFTLSDVQNLVTDLHQKGLVYSVRPGQAVGMIKRQRKERRQKIMSTFKNVLYLRLPGWDPEPTLQWLYPLIRWIFKPWAVCGAAVLVLSSLTLLGVQFEEFRSKLPEFHQFFAWPNLMYMWASLAIAKVIHEFGHGLSCKHFGGECHEMGMMLLVFSPCLYCDVSDSWMLRNKWQRIIIGAAGMYIEIILSAIAIFVWWNTESSLLHHLALNVFFVTTVTTVIFNANPLMRFDGYYMMADWLEIPNLRPKSEKMLREKFAWYCLGIENRPDPFMPETGIAWFVAFAIAAALYRWFILLGIAVFLSTVLKPYGLQSVGMLLAAVSIGGIVISMVVNVYKIISAPRIEPMSYKKASATVGILVLLVVGGLMIPLPLHVESSFTIEPNEVQHVYTSTPGRLLELNVKPGQKVERGELLAVLGNADQEDRYRALEIEKKIQQLEVQTYHALDDKANEQLSFERLQDIEEEIADYEQQLAHLKITAPCDGVVVAPRRLPEPKHDNAGSQLSGWFGSPLDEKNLMSFLEERAHLLSIAPNEKVDAILVVDQGDRNDVFVGQEVELKFDHLPAQTLTGTVREISQRHLEFAPPSLSNKFGGDLATVSDGEGREKLTSIAYQATVSFDPDPQLLKPGLRGRARFLVEKRTAGDWIWRYLCRTFHFRL